MWTLIIPHSILHAQAIQPASARIPLAQCNGIKTFMQTILKTCFDN